LPTAFLGLGAYAPAAVAMSNQALAQYAKLPDWSGLWKLKGSAALLDTDNARMFAPGNRDHAPYKPDWEARYQANLKRAEDQGNQASQDPLVDTNTVYCLAGMPRDIATPFEYQFVNAPGKSWIMVGGEIRNLYTDGRPRPDDDTIWAKFIGWSTGRWEGDVLVIETTNLKGGLWADTTPMILSDQAVVRERVHLAAPNLMQDDVVIEDPVAFSGPWRFSRQYVRINEWGDEKEVCGGSDDRNPIQNGRVTVKVK